MTKKYSFFRDGDEQAQAVIGEDAIAADLNGTYQKPYAVLTQKRLYCKNERGNFIVGADKLLGADLEQNASNQNILWIAFAVIALGLILVVGNGRAIYRGLISYYEFYGSDNYYAERFARIRANLTIWTIFFAISIICLIVFLISQRKRSKISPFLLCITPIVQIASVIYYIYIICNYEGWPVVYALINYFFSFHTAIIFRFIPTVLFVVAIIFCVISATNNKATEWFEIRHTTGMFTFSPKLYPAGELKNFEKQVKALQAGGTNGQ